MTRTIGDVIREENQSLEAGCKKFGMYPIGDLRDFKPGDDRYIWLGGFKRFAKIVSIGRDWWVSEGGYGGSWACTPDTTIYAKV